MIAKLTIDKISIVNYPIDVTYFCTKERICQEDMVEAVVDG
jgi:hypothetical protein